MTKRFLSTLAVYLLGFATIQAQAPFTGRVEYKMEVGSKEAAPPNFIVHYNKLYIILQANIPDKEGQVSEETLVIDFVTGNTYEISHKAKKIVKKSFAISKENEMQLANTPINWGKIANIPAKAYKGTVSGMVNCTIWLADSLPLAVPANLKKTNDLFMWATDRLMLKIEVPGTDSFAAPFGILAISIKPDTAFNKPFHLPTGYSFTDEKALEMAKDSLLRAFNKIDNELAQQRLNDDSAQRIVNQLNGPVKKKATSPKKRKKTSTAKGSKPLARRPKQ
jgi:hypothetical protein